MALQAHSSQSGESPGRRTDVDKRDVIRGISWMLDTVCQVEGSSSPVRQQEHGSGWFKNLVASGVCERTCAVPDAASRSAAGSASTVSGASAPSSLGATMSGMTRSARAWAKWRGLVEAQEASGISVHRFCEERGIPASSVFARDRRDADEGGDQAAPS
jgi:hypothetical protein